MKRLFIILFVTLISISTNAQIIVEAGYFSYTRRWVQDFEENFFEKPVPGPFISIKKIIPLNSGFGIEAGLSYSFLRGDDIHSILSDSGQIHTYKSIGQLFTIPVTFNYKYSLSDRVIVGANLGPNASYLISQHWEKETGRKWKYRDEYEMFYRWDYGIQTGLFCDIFNHFRISFDYYWGCRNIAKFEESSVHTRFKSVGLAYIF